MARTKGRLESFFKKGALSSILLSFATHPHPTIPSPSSMLLRRFFSALLLLTPLYAAETLPKPKAEHVLLVVWDGMRPDFINAQNTPNLYALAQRGTFFAHNHSFWPTTTEVNGTVFSTGVFPARSTVVANKEYRPDIDPKKPVGTDDAEVMIKGDSLTGGHYLGVPTVVELARQAGFPTAVAGTKPVALLQDRSREKPATPKSAIVFGGKIYPAHEASTLEALLGPFPIYKASFENPKPNTAGNRWTTRALLEYLWRDGVPRYSVLWLSDPDFPQHASAPGEPAALSGIHDSDTHLGMAIDDLKKRGLLDKTDIFVVSDHGFSTIGRTVDPVKYYNDHEVPAVKQFTLGTKPGQVISVSVGGATGLYVIGHDAATIAKLVELLQASDFSGPIFTKAALPGTFALKDAHIDSPYAADIVFAFRWSIDKNKNGTPGLIVAEGREGLGMHGSLSPFDTHNTLVAGGPDIREGYRDEFPSGNIDVAPTILHLLGLKQTAGSDGRILSEALADTPLPEEKPVTKHLEATRNLENGAAWKQYLETTTFAGKTYFDEGNSKEGLK
jgi:arylsulfatase A-like enzyme